MIDADALLADTKKQVVSLVDDLRTVAATDPEAAAHVTAEYGKAQAAGRTAFGQAEWAEGLYAQVAVAWVLGCVFVRFCEDNDLIEDPLLGGPGIRGQVALDHRAAYLQANHAHDDRHWLREVFGRLRALPATGEIFGGHNPVWVASLLPSADGARKLREEIARVDPESGTLRHDFTDSTWDTRFLGDLYQDLSEHAKKAFALLQTPVFVEEFILDRTLDPAIATFGLAETTIIDPTCGSGHFLLGAFARLFDRWCEVEPTTSRRELARRSLDAIGGIDLNPFAASIARFRILVAALRAGGDERLRDAPAYPIHIAVGDSLLHGEPPGQLPGVRSAEEESLVSHHGYSSEDLAATRQLLGRTWRAVVGNPPYILAPDPALNSAYRARFKTCSGKYSLAVPFVERFWQLATDPSADVERAGYVGAIVSNSFMTRAMGRTLVRDWLPLHDLTHALDTSKVELPGHGTPTVVLLGRARRPVSDRVVVASLQRGGPTPDRYDGGPIWQAFLDEVERAERDPNLGQVTRDSLRNHPWSLSTDGTVTLRNFVTDSKENLGALARDVGASVVFGEQEPYCRPTELACRRAGLDLSWLRLTSDGGAVRDWGVTGHELAVFPYDESGGPQNIQLEHHPAFWPYRTSLAQVSYFGKNKGERGLRWFDYGTVMKSRLPSVPKIVYAYVETGNQFALVDDDRIFDQSALICTFPPGTSRERLLGVLGVCNSSIGCFLMRTTGLDKGMSGGVVEEPYERFFMYNASVVEALPMVEPLPIPVSSRIHDVAQEYHSRLSISEECSVQELAKLAESTSSLTALQHEMISLQEQLDWECYVAFGLTDESYGSPGITSPPLEPGQRAFEIHLARCMDKDGLSTSWFRRTGAVPSADLPDHWEPDYRHLVERRIELLSSDPRLALLERPETKRRWFVRSSEERVKAVFRAWLVSRLEDGRYWSEPAAITTVGRLTAAARADEDFQAAARLYSGNDDFDLGNLIRDLVTSDSVAYLAALRYTDSGLRKQAEWLKTWSLQRKEDQGADVGVIPVPPKYAKADFLGSGWDHRSKLDVPKERFISYPRAERETDASAVVGWAGWNHLDRARALATWYLQARRDGRDAAHLTPLLAGLAELVPWLMQWYDEPSTDPALDRPGSQIAALVDTELRSLSLTAEDLAAWRPEKKKAVRKKKAAP